MFTSKRLGKSWGLPNQILSSHFLLKKVVWNGRTDEKHLKTSESSKRWYFGWNLQFKQQKTPTWISLTLSGQLIMSIKINLFFSLFLYYFKDHLRLPFFANLNNRSKDDRLKWLLFRQIRRNDPPTDPPTDPPNDHSKVDEWNQVSLIWPDEMILACLLNHKNKCLSLLFECWSFKWLRSWGEKIKSQKSGESHREAPR